MNFWETVDLLREFKNFTRKELAYKAGFSMTSLTNGIARNSIPAADVAYRIAKVLDVSVEYLLTGKNPESKNSESKLEELLKSKDDLFLKYYDIVDMLDRIGENMREPIISMIKLLFEKHVDETITKSYIDAGEEPPFDEDGNLILEKA